LFRWPQRRWLQRRLLIERAEKRLAGERLAQKAGGSQQSREIFLGQDGADDHWYIGCAWVLAQLRQQPPTVYPRHHHIQDDHAGL